MLTELRIKNFAIIESLTLPLARGFNVLSGETGAGKSIIVGALGLLLGERANADVIRTGAERATVEGVFDIHDRQEIRTLLDERGIDVDDAIVVLKREVSLGRARAWINGTTVNAGLLAEVGRMLVNLHGQHEAQTLLDPDAQRRILDAFAASTEQAARVRSAHEDLALIIREISDLTRRRSIHIDICRNRGGNGGIRRIDGAAGRIGLHLLDHHGGRSCARQNSVRGDLQPSRNAHGQRRSHAQGVPRPGRAARLLQTLTH
jgi:DNA repair ATPase RecN